jgi:hypothetical protein
MPSTEGSSGDGGSRNPFVSYYSAQAGGSLPYYKGAPSMRGYGIGSWFMNMFRRAVPLIAPIVRTAATRFIDSARQNMEQGRSFGESLKQGATDAGTGALDEGIEMVKKKMRGGKRKKPIKGRGAKRRPSKKRSALGGRIQLSHLRGHGRKRRRKTYKRSKTAMNF